MTVTVAQLRRLALAQPGAAELPHHDMLSWRAPGAKGRIFATLTPDGAALHLFVSETERDRALALYAPAAELLMWGTKPAGVRLWLAQAALPVVRELLEQSYTHKVTRMATPKAPRRSP